MASEIATNRTTCRANKTNDNVALSDVFVMLQK